MAQATFDSVLIINPIDFTIQFINRARPGSKIEDYIGKVVFANIFPQNIEKYKTILNTVVKTKTGVTVEIDVPDKTNPSQILSFQCIIEPVCDESGEIESLLIISKDVTTSKLKEKDLVNKEERLFAIVNNTKDIILSINKDLKITECNTVFSNLIESVFKKRDLTNTPVLDYVDPKKHNHLKEIYAKVFNGEVIVDIESFESPTNSEGTSKSKMYNETSYHPIKNYKHQIIGISIFSKNITERVLSEQALQKTLKERDILLSEIHHRIKNNLALVSSMLHLKEMSIDNEEAKDVLADSRKRIKSTSLVHEMLYTNDRFDKISLKEYVVELFNNVKLNSTIELVLEGDDYVLGIEKSFPFGLLMHELIMNSMKHSFKEQKTGKLKLIVALKNEELKIEYFDCSGKFHDHINFNDTSTTGLMLVHTFIQQLNGSIKLTCKEPPAYDIRIPLL